MKKNFKLILMACLFLSKNVFADDAQHQFVASAKTNNAELIEPIDLKKEVEKILKDANDNDSFNAGTCHQYIDKRTWIAYKTPSSQFKLPDKNDPKQSLEIIDNLFKIRLALHEKLRAFDQAGSIGTQCVDSIREANQFIRFAEEYLMEWTGLNNGLTKGMSFLSVDKPHKMVNEKFRNNSELKAGDVLVIRGNANVSAMIARLGDEESIFSHSAIVGEDQNKEKYIVEALIPYGLVHKPLNDWLKETRDARVAVYRFNDEAMAWNAGRMIFDYASKEGKDLPYDFAMNESDQTSFFCSEVAQYGYSLASSGNIILPKYRTAALKLKASTSFFKDMGIKSEGSLFSPADIEVDPRFELVLDFRDLSENRLTNARRKDAVLQSIYQWMTRDSEKDRYNFHSTLKYQILASLVQFARQFGMGSDIFPKHIPFNTLKTLLNYDSVAAILLKNLEEEEAQNRLTGKPSLSFQDLMIANDKYREKDCKKHHSILQESDESQAYGVVQPGGYSYIPVQNKTIENTSEFHDFFRGTCTL